LDFALKLLSLSIDGIEIVIGELAHFSFTCREFAPLTYGAVHLGCPKGQ
jgi:hypothetical protein